MNWKRIPSSVLTFFSFLPYMPWTLYLNFKALPLKQAIHLPILLYKPHFRKFKGKITIQNKVIKFGMIRLGVNCVGIYPNNGITLDIDEGHIIFDGLCIIGNNSFIYVGKLGELKFGNNFQASSSLKIACQKKVTFGDDVLIGWDCLFTDSDFHKIQYGKDSFSKSTMPIEIDKGCWFGNNCIILKGTQLKKDVIIGAATILTGDKRNLGEANIIANKKETIVIREDARRI